jgi:hypothetical protein
VLGVVQEQHRVPAARQQRSKQRIKLRRLALRHRAAVWNANAGGRADVFSREGAGAYPLQVRVDDLEPPEAGHCHQVAARQHGRCGSVNARSALTSAPHSHDCARTDKGAEERQVRHVLFQRAHGDVRLPRRGEHSQRG